MQNMIEVATRATAAQERYLALEGAIKTRADEDAVSAEIDRLVNEVETAVDLMITMRARTIAEIKAKAAVLAAAYVEDTTGEQYEKLILSLTRDIAELPT